MQYVFFGLVWATGVRPCCRVNENNDLRKNQRKSLFSAVLLWIILLTRKQRFFDGLATWVFGGGKKQRVGGFTLGSLRGRCFL
jgi:hypothetical protein